MIGTITIEDVAREAGVSIGTVSRVINGKDRVHPQTRERIQQIIKRMNYHPSALGRGLITRRSHNIMVLTHNIADPFCVALAKHLSRLCRKQGYKLLVGDSDYDPEIEAECLGLIRDGSVDGLIVSPVGGRRNLPLFRDLGASGFPVVAVTNPLPGCLIPCVKFDDRCAGRIATDYLLDRGHRHIAFADWHTEFQTVLDRYHGYLDSHASRKMPVRRNLHLKFPLSLKEVRDRLAAALALKQPPTALVVVNEMVALTCLNALGQLNRRVPEDLAVVAFGDKFPDGSLPKPITVVSLPEGQLAERAWEKLQQRMQNRGTAPRLGDVELVEPDLSVRQTA